MHIQNKNIFSGLDQSTPRILPPFSLFFATDTGNITVYDKYGSISERNASGTVKVSYSSTIVFDRTEGYRHGTWDTPISGVITLSDQGLTEGACAVMIWSGSSNPTISGGVIQSLAGEITEAGTYSIYFHYLNGRFNVNIFNVGGTTPPVGTPSATVPTITVTE